MMTQKTISKLPLLALLLLAILSGCADKSVQIFTANVPQYQSLESFRSQGVQMQPAQALERPGKIYLYRNYLLVNEVMKGIHFYDNSNPSAPVSIGFLPIIANVDMAVNNDILYVDSYSDLLAINISDPANPVLVQRVNDVFTFTAYGLLEGYDHAYPMIFPDATQGIVTSFVTEKTEQESSYYSWSNISWGNGGVFTMDQTLAGNSSNGANNIGGAGIAGSLARFAIAEGHLYVLQSWSITVFDLQGDLREVREVSTNFNAETLFPADGHLYVGGTTGMGIFSLQDPSNPTFISIFTHIESCDPVVVQGDYAYVTLRTGNTCAGSFNLLEVVDISVKSAPTLVASFTMINPHGLGVDGNTLFLCDGSDGLKVFDKTDHANIPQNMLGHFTNITAQDVIPHNDVLIMTSADGIYQYSYADPTNVTQLSLIPAQN